MRKSKQTVNYFRNARLFFIQNLKTPIDKGPEELHRAWYKDVSQPNVIEPEIFLVIAYQVSLYFNHDLNAIKQYLGIFFNSVSSILCQVHWTFHLPFIRFTLLLFCNR